MIFSIHFWPETFLGAACLVASPTTRAEKLPEGLEEQVESTIIDPIARLRESSFKFSSSQKVNQKPNWLQRRWYPGALARIIPSTHPLQKQVFPVMASPEVFTRHNMWNYHYLSWCYTSLIYDVKSDIWKMVWPRLLCRSGVRVSVVPHLRRGRPGGA